MTGRIADDDGRRERVWRTGGVDPLDRAGGTCTTPWMPVPGGIGVCAGVPHAAIASVTMIAVKIRFIRPR
jgi:hypothetical protein